MTEKETSVRAVERALDVLDCFSPTTLELSLTDISKRISLAMSTASRIVSTLEKRGYLFRDVGTQKYLLGSRIAQIGALGFSSTDLRKIALPFMLDLNSVYNEGISLYVVQDNQRVCVERVQSTQPLRRVINVGDRYPLTRGASGRVLLAYLPEGIRSEILKEDPFTTENSLAELRAQGYTVSIGERENGVTSIAAPVKNAKREVVASLAMSGPSVRFGGPDFPERVRGVIEHAGRISRALGLQE